MVGKANNEIVNFTLKCAASNSGDSAECIDSIQEYTSLFMFLRNKNLQLKSPDINFLREKGIDYKLYSDKAQNKRHQDLINQSMHEGKEIAMALKELNKTNSGFLGINRADEARKFLQKINKDNVAYVVKYMPDIADYICDIDAFGFGLDENDVIKYVIEPLSRKVYGQKSQFALSNASRLPMISTEFLVDAEVTPKELRINFCYDDMKKIIKQFSNCAQASDSEFTRQFSLMYGSFAKTSQNNK